MQAGGPRSVSRRAVASGTLWSIPVLTVAAAAPAFAASDCMSALLSPKHTASAPASTSGAGLTTNWTVPAGVTSICVKVNGGGGGGSTTGRPGGDGASLVGRIQVTPGETLKLTVGAGGTRSAGTAGSTGGTGYGNGGSTVNGETNTGGSGGAGSAIVRGTTPLVVAGGGGGTGGHGRYQNATYTWTYTGGAGGDAAENGDAAGLTLTNASSFSATLPGGNGANGATGGAVTTQPTFTGGGTVVTSTVRTSGAAGSAGPAGNGANGVSATANTYLFNSGAGGGGYAGGGSGSVIAVFTNKYDVGTQIVAVAGAGGGGGSSYFDASVIENTVGTAGNGGTVAGTRGSGSIAIAW